MKVQNGVDLIRIERIAKAIEKGGRPFLDRIWTTQEQTDCLVQSDQPPSASIASLAARFAAKEAVAKALGTGIGPRGVRWIEIEIIRQASGQPMVSLSGAAAACFGAMGGTSISVSLAHDGSLAMAHCVVLYQEQV